MTARTIRNRVKKLEKKICSGDVPVLMDFGGKKFLATPNEIRRIIKAAQGTCLKPVTSDEESREREAKLLKYCGEVVEG